MTLLNDDPRHTVLFDVLQENGTLSKEQVEKAKANALAYFAENGYPPYSSFELHLNSYIKIFEGIFTPEQVIVLASKAIESLEK